MDFLTGNHYGATFPPCSYTREFIDFALRCGGESLDIGACFGVNTLPVLAGGGRITANDINQAHLDRLHEAAPMECRGRLHLLKGEFPKAFADLASPCFSAILAAHVLHFLNLPELFEGVRTLRRLLVPGGRVFVLCFSPFTHRTRKFVEIYEQRRRLGDAFPGFIRDVQLFGLDDPALPPIPALMNYMDHETLVRVFTETGFTIYRSGYEPFPDVAPPEIRARYHYDGREWVGLVAGK